MHFISALSIAVPMSLDLYLFLSICTYVSLSVPMCLYLYLCLSICTCFSPSVPVSLHRYPCLSICTYVSIWTYVSLSVLLCLYLYLCHYICTYVSLSVPMCLYLSVLTYLYFTLIVSVSALINKVSLCVHFSRFHCVWVLFLKPHLPTYFSFKYLLVLVWTNKYL